MVWGSRPQTGRPSRVGRCRPISGYRWVSGYRPISGYRWASGCCPVSGCRPAGSGYRPISGYPPVTRIRQNPDATGAWRTDIRIRIRHGYPDFRIRLRALIIIQCPYRIAWHKMYHVKRQRQKIDKTAKRQNGNGKNGECCLGIKILKYQTKMRTFAGVSV